MSTQEKAERVFLSTLVRNTKALVAKNDVKLALKLKAIQEAVRENNNHLGTLNAAKAKATEDEAVQRLARWVEVRVRAHSYLINVARWLMSRSQHPFGIHQSPRILADPGWKIGNGQASPEGSDSNDTRTR